MVVQLLAGMFLGSVVASLVWWLILKSVKNKGDQSRHIREDIMRSLGELLVGIDSLFSSHRSGAIEEKALREALSARVDAINKLLKPNLHMLEVYYVKYIENLMAGYNRVARKGLTLTDSAIGSTSDIEMETNYSVVEEPETSVLSAPADTTDEKMNTVTAAPQLIVDEADVAIGQEVTTTTSAAEEVISIEEKPHVETASAPRATADEVSDVEVVMAPEIETISDEEESVVLEKAAEPPKEEAVTIKNEEKNAPAATEPASKDEEITFEKSSEATRETIYGVDESVFETDAGDLKSTVGTAPSPAAAQKPEPDFFHEEDFSMETLMDVDISTIHSYIKPGSGSKDPTPVDTQEQALFEVSGDADAGADTGAKQEKAVAGESLDVIIASHVSHTETPQTDESEAPVSPKAKPVKTGKKEKKNTSKEDDAIPDETTYTRAEEMADQTTAAKTVEEAAAEDFEVMFEQGPIVKVSTEQTVSSQDKAQSGVTQADIDAFDKEEEIITGDDVAEKIASWEFKKPAEPVKPPVKKEKKKEKNAAVKSTGAKTPSPAEAKSHATTGKKSPSTTASKEKTGDDTITGDDVSDKIDTFFGLFKD